MISGKTKIINTDGINQELNNSYSFAHNQNGTKGPFKILDREQRNINVEKYVKTAKSNERRRLNLNEINCNGTSKIATTKEREKFNVLTTEMKRDFDIKS